MMPLERVRVEHERALLVFEVQNRSYFARSISDRGDAYFELFSAEHRELLAAQETGSCSYYVFTDEHGLVVGRFNLYDVAGGTARIGYRVAERVSGQGVATAGVRSLCRIARVEFGLQSLTAAVSNENTASTRVLRKAGFGYVEATEVGGREGALFRIHLNAD